MGEEGMSGHTGISVCLIETLREETQPQSPERLTRGKNHREEYLKNEYSSLLKTLQVFIVQHSIFDFSKV